MAQKWIVHYVPADSRRTAAEAPSSSESISRRTAERKASERRLRSAESGRARTARTRASGTSGRNASSASSATTPSGARHARGGSEERVAAGGEQPRRGASEPGAELPAREAMLRDEKRQPGETLGREDSSARDRIKAASENAPACRARKLEVLEAREILRRVDEREMRSALPEVMERLLGVAARGRCAGDLGVFARGCRRLGRIGRNRDGPAAAQGCGRKRRGIPGVPADAGLKEAKR